MQSQNLASRAARWSAGHRKTAIFGWLAFVIAATVLAGMIGGQKTIADEDYGNGSSKVADKAIAAANFRDSAEEQVLVQGKGSVKVGDAAFTAAVKDTVSRLETTKGVDKVKSPLAKGNEGQLSKDGKSALVTFEIPGDDDVTKDRVDSTLAATAAAQKANPRSSSASSATPARTRRSRRPSRTTSRRPSSCPSRSRSSSSSPRSARSSPPASRCCSASRP